MEKKEGIPAWRRIGHEFSRIALKSRANHWELTVPSYWALIAARGSLFPGHFLPDIGVAGNVRKLRHS